MEADRQPLGDDQPGEREGVRRAAHVLLHDAHARCRLEVEAAAVEADALADDRDARVVGLAPFELDQARRALGRRGGADGRDQRIAFGQLVARW